MVSKVFEQLKTLVGKEDHPEYAVESLGIEFEIYVGIKWVDDGKYQLGSLGIQIGDEYFWINASRSGSYYDEYYYNIDTVTQFTPDTRYHVNCTFPNKEVAQDFVNWMCGRGEQTMWESAECSDELDLNRKVEYDYEKGSFEIGGRFDE